MNQEIHNLKQHEELLRTTIAELEARGESLELVSLRLDLWSTTRELLRLDGKIRTKVNLTIDIIRDRFQEKVEVDGDKCWVWTASKNNKGYGVFRFIGSDNKMKTMLSHRVSYIIGGGLIPNGMCILHQCDNPICQNFHHMKTGTHAENMGEMVDRDRVNRNLYWNRKLTEDQAREIKKVLNTEGSIPARHLARSFGVSPNAVWSIKIGRSWKFLN